MPTIRQLQYLVALADTGSFAEAARISLVSQPALSQQVKALEERLGVRLLERSTTGAILTPVGRSIVSKARGVLGEVRTIEELARSAATASRSRCASASLRIAIAARSISLGMLS